MEYITIEFTRPIVRGSGDNAQEINEITLREPTAGELRGLKIMDFLSMDVMSSVMLTSRVSEPKLTRQELESLGPVDTHKIADACANFFVE